MRAQPHERKRRQKRRFTEFTDENSFVRNTKDSGEGGGERNGGSDGQVGADYGELEDGVISVRLRLIPDRGTDTRKRPDVTGGCLSDDVTH